MCGGSDGVLCSADDVQRRNADAWQRPDVVRARVVEHEEAHGPAGSPCRAQPSQVEAGLAFRDDVMNPDSTTYPPTSARDKVGPISVALAVSATLAIAVPYGSSR